MNSRCSDEPAGVVTTTRNVRGTASAEIVSVAVRLVSLSTWTLVTGGWGSVATTSTVVFCGMNFVPVRMTSTFVPGSPLDGLIAASVGAAAIAKSLFDTSAPLRNVDAAIVQAAVERIAALLTRDGELDCLRVVSPTASRR